MRWTCPLCDREFGRERQAHTCVPGITVDQVFAGRPAYQRQVYDGILAALGPVHEDAVTVGVFLLCERKLAEVRPMARSVKLHLFLSMPVEGAKPLSEGRWWLTVSLHDVADIPEDLLALAYDAAL